MPTLAAHELDEWFDEPATRFVGNRELALRKRERAAASEAFREHRRALGCDTVAEYEAWCRRRGLSASIAKSEVWRGRERIAWEIEQTLLAVSEQLGPRSMAILARLPTAITSANGSALKFDADSDGSIEQRLEVAIATTARQLTATGESQALGRLLVRLAVHLLGTRATAETVGEFLIDWMPALGRLARLHRDWQISLDRLEQRNLVCSQCGKIHDETVAVKLVDALVAPKGLPRWLTQMLRASEQSLEAAALSSSTIVDWIRHVGVRKQRARTLTFPIPMSRRAIGQLDRVSRWKYEPLMTLRAAQLFGLDRTASDDRVQMIASSTLGQSIESDQRERFRTELMMWLLAHEELPANRIAQAIRSIERQKFEPVYEWTERGTYELRTRQRELTMSQFSASSLLRRLDAEWDRVMSVESDAAVPRWEDRAVAEHPRRTADTIRLPAGGGTFVMVPLVSREDFVAEGEAMSNCVASYFSKYAAGEAMLWSLRRPAASLRRRRASGPLVRCVTICVSQQNQVSECRGRGNREPYGVEVEAVATWAASRGIDATTSL